MTSEIRTLFRVEGDDSAKTNTATHYTLISEDEDGELKDVNINDLDAWLRGKSNLRGRITRKNVGTYSVEFILSGEAGVYHLDVTLNGRPIFKKGDIQIDVTGVDPVKARLSFEMDGKGLYGGRVGENSEFNIVVKDDFGKHVNIDHHGLQVVLQGPSQVHARIGVESIGRYRASFVVNNAGEYHVDILYDNRKVMEKNLVKFSNQTDPSRSTVTNAPERVRSNTDIQFTIISKDSRGTRIHTGGDDWEALASGPERVMRLTIQDNDDGSYTVTTSLPLQGVYSFDVKFQGAPAGNSPIKIRVD